MRCFFLIIVALAALQFSLAQSPQPEQLSQQPDSVLIQSDFIQQTDSVQQSDSIALPEPPLPPVGKTAHIARDLYFWLGTRLNSVITNLRRNYPQFSRSVSTDEDGYSDITEFHHFIFYHYYFRDRRYIGSATTFHCISKGNPSDRRLFNGLINNIVHFTGVKPVISKEQDFYQWSDTAGTRIVINLIEAPGDTFITVRSMTRDLIEHPMP